jgi:hypothetical protein
LNAFDYAVNSLVSVLLRGAVLLMFLQVGTASHVGAKAWAASFGWSINLSHGDICLGGTGHDIWKGLSSGLAMEG